MADGIHIIPSNKIDRRKWDDCVTRSSNAMLYANYLYLDTMADNWSGVIMGDYEAVMPICWRKKMGIRYAYTVPFIQQLGWYGKGDVNGEFFFSALTRFIRYGDYVFNYANNTNGHNITKAHNYILHLSLPYSKIVAGYTGDALNNIKKAGRTKNIYLPADVDEAITCYQSLYATRFSNTSAKDYAHFTGLVHTLAESGQAFARKITDAATGKTLSIALLLKDQTRLYNIMNSTPDAGRKSSANHLLFDRMFAEFAGTNQVFDFEGSDIPGIGSFYQKFGAVNQPYTTLRVNRLPFPLNILKR